MAKICTTYRVPPSPDIDVLVRILVRQPKGTEADRSSRQPLRLKMDGAQNIPANTIRTRPGIFAALPARYDTAVDVLLRVVISGDMYDDPVAGVAVVFGIAPAKQTHTSRCVRQAAKDAATISVGDDRLPVASHRMPRISAVERIGIDFFDGYFQLFSFRVKFLDHRFQYLPGPIFVPQIQNRGVTQISGAQYKVVTATFK